MIISNEYIREYVIEVMAEYGLTIDLDSYRLFNVQQQRIGQIVWDTTVQEIIGPALFLEYSNNISVNNDFFYVESIPRTSSFGYLMGIGLYKIFCETGRFSIQAATLCSLFNILVSLFDKICDDYTHLSSKLLNRITPKSLSDALHIGEETQGKSHFEVAMSDEPTLRLLLLVTEEFFRRCGTFYMVSRNGTVWQEFKNTISEVYEAEVSSTKLTFSSPYSLEDVYIILRRKSSLPGWILCLIILLSPDANYDGKLPHLKEVMLKLGDLFWIVDDLVDLVEDLEMERWNYVWLKLAMRDEGAFIHRNNGTLSKEILLEKVVDLGIIKEATSDLCQSYIGIRDWTNSLSRDNKNFAEKVLISIYSWLVAL